MVFYTTCFLNREVEIVSCKQLVHVFMFTCFLHESFSLNVVFKEVFIKHCLSLFHMLHLNKINTCLFKLALLISCTSSYLIIDSWCRERGKERWGRRKRERGVNCIIWLWQEITNGQVLVFLFFSCRFISLSVIWVVAIVQYHILLCAFIFCFSYFWVCVVVGLVGGGGGSGGGAGVKIKRLKWRKKSPVCLIYHQLVFFASPASPTLSDW